MGKSRLLAELHRRCDGIEWFRAQCDALGERGGLDPLVDALRECAAATPGLRTRMPRRSRPGRLRSQPWPATAPWCCAVEDAHWASELLLDLIDHLASAPVAAPLVLLVSARPEIEVRRPGWLAATAPVRLSVLDDLEATLLVDAVLAHTGSAEVDRAALVGASGGVPLFAVEMGHALTTDASHQIPEHLSELMSARIDSLDPASPRRADRRRSCGLDVLGRGDRGRARGDRGAPAARVHPRGAPLGGARDARVPVSPRPAPGRRIRSPAATRQGGSPPRSRTLVAGARARTGRCHHRRAGVACPRVLR